jgi:hypothetical protein
MGAAISERHTRATDKVRHGAGDEDFVAMGERLDALGDVDGDAADLVTVRECSSASEPSSADDQTDELVARGAHHELRRTRPRNRLPPANTHQSETDRNGAAGTRAQQRALDARQVAPIARYERPS